MTGAAMDCRDLVELVTDYLEGALDEASEALVRDHLQECVDCLRYLGQIQTTTRLLGSLGEDALP